MSTARFAPVNTDSIALFVWIRLRKLSPSTLKNAANTMESDTVSTNLLPTGRSCCCDCLISLLIFSLNENVSPSTTMVNPFFVISALRYASFSPAVLGTPKAKGIVAVGGSADILATIFTGAVIVSIASVNRLSFIPLSSSCDKYFTIRCCNCAIAAGSTGPIKSIASSE